MAFIDGLGKRISQTGQTAVQRTKAMTDVARINSMISEEEKRVNNSYYQLGKTYVSLHATDYDPSFSDFINAIKESEAKILEYRQQIQIIKGVVRCDNCGAENPNNVAFCSSCGSPMPQSPVVTNTDDRIKCLYCGSMVKKLKFCTVCGKPLSTPEPENQIQNPEPISFNQRTTICPNCGTAMDAALDFCTECGTPLKERKEPLADVVSARNVIDNSNAQLKVCPVCGAQVPSELVFCTECGTKFDA